VFGVGFWGGGDEAEEFEEGPEDEAEEKGVSVLVSIPLKYT
jgi:hypothetical protein